MLKESDLKRGSRDIGIDFSDWSCDYFGNRFWIKKERKRLQERQNQCRIKWDWAKCHSEFLGLGISYRRKFEHITIFSNCDRWIKGKLPMTQVLIMTDHLQFTTHLKELWIPKGIKTCLCNHKIFHTFALSRINGLRYVLIHDQWGLIES